MIAIHNSPSGFHTRWESYCIQSNIPYKRVDCLADDLISQLSDCDAVMWHHSQNNPAHLIIAKQILFAVQHAGLKVFPNFETQWHFDDKAGQKYLLEALNIPLVPSYLFYNKKDALNWVQSASFPKVFKLRGGAGSSNVKLVITKSDARRLINRAFGRGFANYNVIENLKEQFRKWRQGLSKFNDLLKGIARLVILPSFVKVAGKEWGYVYFQDFIPDNNYDIRIITIGDKAFAIKRMVRKGDFRASGSGNILYEKHLFSNDDIQLAFEIHYKLKSQCTAMDFVYLNGKAQLVEISYGFDPNVYLNCPGFWDSDLKWYEGAFDPYGWMVDQVLENGK
jgi:glutathione synthase/RimK-type ligase-like ATP-grasp enzyme